LWDKTPAAGQKSPQDGAEIMALMTRTCGRRAAMVRFRLVDAEVSGKAA
jgi:hypothetical protein